MWFASFKGLSRIQKKGEVMCALLQVVLEVVQNTQFIECLGRVCRVCSQSELLQLQSSAPQQCEAVLKGGSTEA